MPGNITIIILFVTISAISYIVGRLHERKISKKNDQENLDKYLKDLQRQYVKDYNKKKEEANFKRFYTALREEVKKIEKD